MQFGEISMNPFEKKDIYNYYLLLHLHTTIKLSDHSIFYWDFTVVVMAMLISHCCQYKGILVVFTDQNLNIFLRLEMGILKFQLERQHKKIKQD